MTSRRKAGRTEPREHALEARAAARRQEATAARAQAEAYGALSQACAQRARALKVVSLADQAVAKLGGNESERTWAAGDGQRARVHVGLMEREASVHAAQARRAQAEAARADAEAAVSSQKAHLAPLGLPAGHVFWQDRG
ncbi:hypothetical protein [Corallococcus carmarthensis]|uniref:Uncharacterized protein n=1 Tax=Corallococcus carmarthensis TaxID=2316728 RepID=A0A3A8K1I7_9BACT|nr:hypothetical protein [Corallococcus carmarthensis]NOK19700.1 hypothetical protein [Corallococcus carmarthensis]RKH01127.1 hypothetical protein D7X32_21335 [Corallococcus carmarthensis]